jgi:hypothetical protein
MIATKTPIDGIDVGKGKREFGRSGAMIITDPGEAKAIEQLHGPKATGEVVTMPVDDHWTEAGHTYEFRMNGVPWGKYDLLGRRVYDGEEEESQAGFEGGADVPSSPEVQEEEKEIQS